MREVSLVGVLDVLAGYDVAVGVTCQAVGFGDTVGIGLEDDSDNCLTFDGSGFGCSPDGVAAVGVDAYEAPVAPCTVAVEVVAYFRFAGDGRVNGSLAAVVNSM